MNRNEMEALYAFGCPNLKATVERLRMAVSYTHLDVYKRQDRYWQIRHHYFFKNICRNFVIWEFQIFPRIHTV